MLISLWSPDISLDQAPYTLLKSHKLQKGIGTSCCCCPVFSTAKRDIDIATTSIHSNPNGNASKIENRHDFNIWLYPWYLQLQNPRHGGNSAQVPGDEDKRSICVQSVSRLRLPAWQGAELPTRVLWNVRLLSCLDEQTLLIVDYQPPQ